MIADALDQGLAARVSTKFWMEQMGLPFHPTHINIPDQKNRRHSYADLLRYPQRYRVHWQLWSGGTTRLLLWGDPDYVRRFAGAARLYDGDSFEVNEMLATKMLGEPHDEKPIDILTPRYRYYDYEFERYWHFYQLWGRLTYDPGAPPELWEREFARRFGGVAGPHLMKAEHLASGILPRIVASAYRYSNFPTTRGWAEMMRQGDLASFAGLEGSDTAQFESPRDAARRMRRGPDTAARTPADTSRWFAETANAIQTEIESAERSANHDPGNEFRSTVTDPAGDVYNEKLPFGAPGVFPRHWKDEQRRLEDDLKKLVESGHTAAVSNGVVPAAADVKDAPPAVTLRPAPMALPGHDEVIVADVRSAAGIKSLRLRYRHVTQFEDYETAEMTVDPATKSYTARIPASFIDPKWDLMYFVEAIGLNGRGRIYPDLDIETPYVMVPVKR